MREPQGSREDSAPDAHLINFLPDPNAGIGGMIYVYADYFPERVKEIIEQVFMENSRHKHKSFLQSRRSGRGKKSEASIRKGFPGSLAALLLPFLLSTALL